VSQERTFVAIKPDGVERGLIGEIIGRFEKRGLKLVGLKLMRVSVDLAGRHYGEHKGKPFLMVWSNSSPPVQLWPWSGKAKMPSPWLAM
jgi:nucleoside-diphosphate kinase